MKIRKMNHLVRSPPTKRRHLGRVHLVGLRQGQVGLGLDRLAHVEEVVAQQVGRLGSFDVFHSAEDLGEEGAVFGDAVEAYFLAGGLFCLCMYFCFIFNFSFSFFFFR